MQLLRFALQRGWAATSSSLVRDLVSAWQLPFAELASRFALEGPPGSLPLLHTAVMSGAFAAVQAAASWGARYGLPLLWDEPAAGGLSPLHLAAVLPDSGRLAMAIVAHYPGTQWLWTTLAAEDGATPQDYVMMMMTAASGEAAAPASPLPQQQQQDKAGHAASAASAAVAVSAAGTEGLLSSSTTTTTNTTPACGSSALGRSATSRRGRPSSSPATRMRPCKPRQQRALETTATGSTSARAAALVLPRGGQCLSDADTLLGFGFGLGAMDAPTPRLPGDGDMPTAEGAAGAAASGARASAHPGMRAGPSASPVALADAATAAAPALPSAGRGRGWGWLGSWASYAMAWAWACCIWLASATGFGLGFGLGLGARVGLGWGLSRGWACGWARVRCACRSFGSSCGRRLFWRACC